MKTKKKRGLNIVKDVIFRMSPAQIILGILVVVGFVLFVVLRSVAGAFSGTSALSVIILLSIILLIARLSVFVKVGINIFTLLLFCVQLVFNIWVAFAMLFATSAIYIWIAVRPTPIDFAITKGVQNAVAQTVYVSLWFISLEVLFRFLSLQYILSHFVLSYMIGILLYVFFMVIFLPILAREPVPLVVINGIMMFCVQFFVGKYIGVMFLQWLLTV